MPSLLHRTQGYAAYAVRRALGRSPDAKIEALEREVRELKRALAQQLRLFQGLSVNTFGSHVNLDHRQRMHLLSRDDSITLSTVEGLPYAVDFSVNMAEMPFCENALAGIVDCDGGTDDVAGCGGRIEFHAGTYIAAQIEAADDADNVALRLDWCAPEAGIPREMGWWTPPGPPIKWAKISVGDACAGTCVTYAIPVWADSGSNQ